MRRFYTHFNKRLSLPYLMLFSRNKRGLSRAWLSIICDETLYIGQLTADLHMNKAENYFLHRIKMRKRELRAALADEYVNNYYLATSLRVTLITRD